MANLKRSPETLIKEVFSRRAIWDVKNPSHHNRDLVQKQWIEISRKLGVPSVDAVKNKWKHLRDNFRTELKKTVRGTGNPPQPYQTQWTFYNDLLFLEEQMMKKISRTYNLLPGRLNDSSDGYNIGSDNENNDNEILQNSNFLTHSLFDDSSHETLWWIQNNSASNELLTSTNKRKFYHNDYESTVNCHLNDSRNHNNVINDDDFHFMMSLLPFVKSLPTSRKMLIRLKLQELVCNFVYSINRSDTNRNNSTTVSSDHSNQVAVKNEVI